MADYAFDETRRQCRKRVHSGERWDIGGHQCGFKAQPGAEYCHLHGGKVADDPTRDAIDAPTVAATSSVTYRAQLTWKPGDGPVVRIPYRDHGYGFVTIARAVQVDDGCVDISVMGVTRLASSGGPGIGTWDKGGEQQPGEQYTAVILGALRAQGAPEPGTRW